MIPALGTTVPRACCASAASGRVSARVSATTLSSVPPCSSTWRSATSCGCWTVVTTRSVPPSAGASVSGRSRSRSTSSGPSGAARTPRRTIHPSCASAFAIKLLRTPRAPITSTDRMSVIIQAMWFLIEEDMSIDERNAELGETARERLLDAAAKVFAERGYQGASVEAIAAAAGVTEDALHWNFESKAELLFSLLEERVDRRLHLLVGAAGLIAGEETVTPLVSREISSLADEELQLHLLTQEYWALAARDPALRARFAQRQRSLREVVAQAIVAHHEATSVALTYDPVQLATALLALGHGLGMERIIDPDAVPDALFGEMIQLVYDGLILRSASAALRPEADEVAE